MENTKKSQGRGLGWGVVRGSTVTQPGREQGVGEGVKGTCGAVGGEGQVVMWGRSQRSGHGELEHQGKGPGLQNEG